MKSADLAPSRIDRARQKLVDILDRRREGQTGLIAYAGDPHVVTPLTDDTETIANLLPALHPDMMPVLGSKPAAAVELAIQLLRSAGVRSGRVLLITDGVDEKEQDNIFRVLRGSGVDFSVMGVGTPSGAPIPLPRGGFAKDGDDNIVMPGLDEKNLKQLAQRIGGSYRRLNANDSDLDYLLRETSLPDPTQTLALDRSADHWDDKGHWLLVFLLPLCLSLFRRGVVLGLLPLLLFAPAERAQAQLWDNLWLTPDQQAARALEKGDAETAAGLFERPEWAGTAAYQQGEFDTAAEHFSRESSADALYNRGNSLARAGQLDEAIAAYQESLKQKPDQADAIENIALLEELKKQQEQQNSQGQDGNNQEDSDSEGEERDQQSQQPSGDSSQQQDNSDSSDSSQGNSSEQLQDSQENSESNNNPEPGENDKRDTGSDKQQESEASTAENKAGGSAQTATGEPDPEQAEQDQAMEQWLRRVPDDPSGLLRQKFLYESKQRQRAGDNTDTEGRDESYW